MFEEYLSDSSYFVTEARSQSTTDERVARRGYRVAAMVGVAAMETFVNFIAGTLAEARERGLKSYELALLLDRRFGQSDGVFRVFDQVAYSRLEDKLRFLIDRFRVDILQKGEWTQFLEFKRLRDSLVHSRSDEDEKTLTEYDAECVRGVRATFLVMDALSEGIFRKPLRRGLHDLVEFGG